MGEKDTIKKYSSVVTTVAVVKEIIQNINSEEELLRLCQNRSVFTEQQIKFFWGKYRNQTKVLKFIFVKSLVKRPTLGKLWELGIIQPPGGPRPFTQISDAQFEAILQEAQTSITCIDC